MLKCECCGRMSISLIPVKREKITQSICNKCFKDEEKISSGCDERWKNYTKPLLGSMGKSTYYQGVDESYLKNKNVIQVNFDSKEKDGTE